MAHHKWRFFRAGGFDQVLVETGADLLALKELDQKLWVALSCPVDDIEFDRKTLDYIDANHDGHIRVQEILAAIEWAGSVVRNPEDLVRGEDGISPDMIDDTTEEGALLVETAREILKRLGKSDTDSITVEDISREDEIFSKAMFNGDGIICSFATDNTDVQSVINDIIECLGPENDKSGLPGISQKKADQFFDEIISYAGWIKVPEDDPSILPVGPATESAYKALVAVRDKVNDYFIRCSIAEFDQESAKSLNPSETEYRSLAGVNLSETRESFAAFPVALAGPGRPLPLGAGINPAWTDAISKLHEQIVVPLLGDRDVLTGDEWGAVNASFSHYEQWIARKPITAVEKLGPERIARIAGDNYKPLIDELFAKEMSYEGVARAISSVDRLVRYTRDLLPVVNNFVAFRYFYTHKAMAVFQTGTLYVDGRSCDLCVKVKDVAKHVALSQLSRAYLAYCQCVRENGAGKMTIAAAITAGDSDQLMVGRNGVFYDRQGRDWDATIVRIIEHPISIKQAFWAPYKRVVRMVSEQFQKLAAARSKSIEDKMASQAVKAGEKAEPGKGAAAQAFDVGKFAGIFAAIGLAVGAIGTAFASIVAGLFKLQWWQFPLVVAAVLLVVSGPSMLMAWLKLRQRNLGPILDANGWAVNARAKLNIPFGASLTSMAKLPPGAKRSKKDPYAEKGQPWLLYLVLAAAVVFLVLYWNKLNIGQWLCSFIR